MRYTRTRMHVTPLAAMMLLFGTLAYAAGPGTDAAKPGGGSPPVSGTIEGEVKKVDPSVVIIEKEAGGQDTGQEVRLPLNESTHKGDIKQGDKVEAFVTPGGTTTSVQPKKEGFNR